MGEFAPHYSNHDQEARRLTNEAGGAEELLFRILQLAWDIEFLAQQARQQTETARKRALLAFLSETEVVIPIGDGFISPSFVGLLAQETLSAAHEEAESLSHKDPKDLQSAQEVLPRQAALLFEYVWYRAALQFANRLVEGLRAVVEARDGASRQDADQAHIFISSSSLQAHMITPLRDFFRNGDKEEFKQWLRSLCGDLPAQERTSGRVGAEWFERVIDDIAGRFYEHSFVHLLKLEETVVACERKGLQGFIVSTENQGEQLRKIAEDRDVIRRWCVRRGFFHAPSF